MMVKKRREVRRVRLRDFWDDYHIPVLSGIIGSFIGMAIAKLIGIL